MRIELEKFRGTAVRKRTLRVHASVIIQTIFNCVRLYSIYLQQGSRIRAHEVLHLLWFYKCSASDHSSVMHKFTLTQPPTLFFER